MANVWNKVELVRNVDRPNSLDYINLLVTDFIELHGDRQFGDDKAMVCGIAKFLGEPVTIIAQQKGKNTKEKVERNFGMPHPEGYRKALRLMKQAEKFNRPIICLVDTTAAFCDVGSEERGQGEAIARNLLEMSQIKVPIISIILGEGGSGGALAIAVADEVWMLENSLYSILPPEGFANILWKDGSRAKDAAEIMKMTAQELKDFEIIDKIIREKKGGVHKDIYYTVEHIKEELKESLAKLRKKTKKKLIDDRYMKYRKMGKIMENVG